MIINFASDTDATQIITALGGITKPVAILYDVWSDKTNVNNFVVIYSGFAHQFSYMNPDVLPNAFIALWPVAWAGIIHQVGKIE